MDPLIRRYEADAGGIERFYRLPFGQTGRNRVDAMNHDWLARLDAVPYDRLGLDGRVDYHLLRGEVEYNLRLSPIEQKREGETLVLLPFAPRIVALEEARGRLVPVNSEAAAGELAAISEAAKKLQSDLSKGTKPDPALALRGANALRDLSGTLARWYAHYSGFKPLFTWWCRKPYEDAKAQLDSYEKRLREDTAGVRGKDEDPLLGTPIGRDALLSDLQAERIAYTPEELIGFADQEFAWCEEEMKRAARDMGMGDDWKAALAKVKADHAAPGEQDDAIAKLAREAIAFVDARNLVTVPELCRETWRVDMVSPEGQKFLPFAAYGGQRMLVAYAAEAMSNDDKQMSMRGNNAHFTRIVVPHELIPGHHLQGFMAQRHRAYRERFSTPFLVEGWSLYWEMLLWDLGYPQTPQDRIGMLFWRMHRCARITVSLGYHLGKMNPQQMVDYLVEKVGHERFPATSEVRRFISGGYSPLYQCGYMVGGLQLRALYREKVMTGPNRMTPKAFHDAVLHQGPIPVDLIRARLTENNLPRQAAPAWRWGLDHSPVRL